ncbi:oxidoreductase [Nocardioides sp.]|uniref:oxidoreductase n=1 Tax=Nocardioides sp. TaxID=35761 RepID=UPI002734E0F4|nr:oxidoreductase [Nocardioides sp.]MDP3893460.1 oxidoreductase [Nocardioides sp.]
MSDDWTTWSLADLPDQSGRTLLVTGVTSGIGAHTARELLRRGARVILAARSADKLDDTARTLHSQVPGASTERLLVDLSDLSSVRRAGAEAARFGPIDVLVNNAGVMATPQRRTGDGLELQMATNHFGPFLLSGLLLPQLAASGDGRIVSVSSNGHRLARTAPLSDPRVPQRHYRRWVVYAQSKLANLLFTFEADRRLRTNDLPVRALAAHPGYAATHLLSSGATGGQRAARRATAILDAAMKAGSQTAEMGALPTLMAATADLPGSTYCGPSGFQQLQGLPRVVGCTALARNRNAQRRLWEVSEETVGLRWP